MQFIKNDKDDQQFGDQSRLKCLISSIFLNQQLLSSRNFSSSLPNSNQPPIMMYTTFMQISQLDIILPIIWEIKLLEHTLIIKLYLHQELDTLAQEIDKVCKKDIQKVKIYLNHVNEMEFQENDGQFSFNQYNKILFKYKESSWYAIKKSNQIKIKSILYKKIIKINQTFTTQMVKFLQVFKVIPHKQQQMRQILKIKFFNQMKYFFQQNKKNPNYPSQLMQNIEKARKYYTADNFKSIQKFDQNLIMKMTQCRISSEQVFQTSYNFSEHDSDQFLHTINSQQYNEKDNKQQFQQNKQRYPATKDHIYHQFKLKCHQYTINQLTNVAKNIQLSQIVISMQVISVNNKIELNNKGGFGEVSRALYTCKYGYTIYDQVNKLLIAQQQNNNRKQAQSNILTFQSYHTFNRYLCRKTPLQSINNKYPSQHQKSKICSSFQNEKRCLINIRNKKCSQIAQYYCNTTKIPFDNQQIYMDVYAGDISSIPIKLKYKFKIIKQIIKGLIFLNRNDILHRDLKPQNVVVDRQMNAKIIDFGSACNVYQRQTFKPYDNKLKSTQGYFAIYKQYYKNVNTKPETSKSTSSSSKQSHFHSQQQFNQHFFFDIYSFGKIVSQLFNIDKCISAGLIQDDFLLSQIYYLREKCCDINPANRLSHQEILFFLDYLIKQIHLSEYHKGSDPIVN